MQIFVTEPVTRIDFSVDVKEDARLCDVFSAIANSLDVESTDDVELFAEDEQLHSTADHLSDFPSLYDGCRLEARRTWRRCEELIASGKALLRSLPDAARRDPGCAAASVSQAGIGGRAAEVHPSLWAHTATMTAAVRRCPTHHYHNAPAALRANRDFALASLRDRELYWRMPEALREDEDVVTAALQCVMHDLHFWGYGNTRVFTHLPASMRANPVLVEKATGFARAADSLRGDKAFVLKHIEFMFEHATEELRSDRELLLAADLRSIRFAGQAARRDAETMLALIRKHRFQAVEGLLVEPLLADKAFVIAAVAKAPMAIRQQLFPRLHPSLREDPDVCCVCGADFPAPLSTGEQAVPRALKWVQYDPRGFRRLPEVLRADIGVALVAVELFPDNYRYLRPETQRDTRVACAALLSGLTLRAVPRELRSDREVVRAAVLCNGDNMKFVPDSLRDDRAVALAVVAQPRAAYFPWLSDRMRDDPEVAAEAVAKDPNHAALAGPHSGIAGVRIDRFRRGVAEPDSDDDDDEEEEEEEGARQARWSALLRTGRRHYHAVPLALREDARFAALAVKDCKDIFWQLGCAMRATPLVAEAALSKGISLADIDPPACSDAGVVRHAIETDAKNLVHASQQWRDDRDVVLAAVQQRSCSLLVASSRLCADRDVVLAALRQAAGRNHHGNADVPALLAAASEQLRSDAEVVLCAVECNGAALQHASTALRADRATATTAGIAGLPFASSALRGDVHFMLPMLRRKPGLVAHADPSMLRDKTAALLLLQDLPSLFARLSQELRDDPDVARAARWCCRGTACLSDRAFVLELMEERASLFCEVAVPLRDDPEVVLAAVAGDAKNFYLVRSAMQQQRDVVIAAFAGGLDLSRVEGPLRSDKEVVLAAVRCNPSNIRFASEALRDDREVALAVATQPRATYFPWLSDRLRDDPDVAVAAVQQNGKNFTLAGEEVRGDRDILLLALQNCEQMLGGLDIPIMHCASPALQADPEVARLAVESDPSNSHYIDPCVLASVEETFPRWKWPSV